MRLFSRTEVPREPLRPIENAAAVDCRALSLARDGRVILDALTLQLTERRIGIVGDNGSGKSSLVRLFNGLLQPDAGELRIYGHEAVSNASRLPALVGFLFQNPDHQILMPTVLEELAFGLCQQGMSQAQADSRAREKLSAEGCQDWADRPAQSLSEGEKQRLCLWAISLMGPSMLVLDESLASLDLRNRRSIMRELASQSQQLIMISHELDLLADFDRVLWLHEGKVAADGPAASVLERYRQHAEALP